MIASERAFEDLLSRTRGRFYGKYRGKVADVDEKTLRIKATVPAVLGSSTTGWCLPCVPYAGPQVGMAFLPEVGSAVWIEFEEGDVSLPIWAGCYWNDNEQPPEAKAAVKVIVTKGGNRILLDDDQKSITISDDNGNEIVLDSNGLKLAQGSKKVEITKSSVKINDTSLEVL